MFRRTIKTIAGKFFIVESGPKASHVKRSDPDPVQNRPDPLTLVQIWEGKGNILPVKSTDPYRYPNVKVLEHQGIIFLRS
jgi:hypothetical protein